MASFSQTIQGKYGVKSYQDTKNTYDWIMKSLEKGKFLNLEVSTEFLFWISEIRCKCNNIIEFTEHAYGQKDYRLISMHFSITSTEEGLWFLSVDSNSSIGISANSKSLLEKIVGLLRSTFLDKTEKNDPISITYIEHQDNSVTVNGDSNIIANNNSTILDKQEKPEAKVSNWIQGICQGMLANLMWWILGLVAVALLAWAVSNGYIGR